MIPNLFHLHDFVDRDGLNDDKNYEEIFKLLKAKQIKKAYFLEHLPWTNQDDNFPTFNDRLVNYQDMWLFKNKLLEYGKKYGVQCYFGAEIEFCKCCWQHFTKAQKDMLYDFFILGNHFFETTYFDETNFISWNYLFNYEKMQNYDDLFSNPKHVLKVYCQDFVHACKQKIISFFAHPDIWLYHIENYYENKQLYHTIIKKIISTALKYNIPLAFNTSRYFAMQDIFLKNNIHFWEEVAKAQVPVIIESDAHHFNDLKKQLNGEFDEVKELLTKQLKCNLCEDIEMKLIHQNLKLELKKVIDVHELRKLEVDIFKYEAYDLDQLEAMVKNRNYEFFYLYKDEQLIGYAIVLISDKIDIMHIGIDKHHRKNGYGTMLVNYLKHIFKKKDLILEVSVLNLSAIEFYKANGFKQISVREKYYPNNVDALILSYHE